MLIPSDYNNLKEVLSSVGADHQDTYLNSAPYYVARGRKGFWLHKGADSCLVVCRHPHIDECLLVFPEVGRGADSRLTALVLDSITVPRNGVHLARYIQEELNALQHRLAEYERVIRLEVEEKSIMDWLYPIHILNTDKVARLPLGEGFSNVRQKVKDVERYITVHNLRAIDNLRLVRSVVRLWESRMIWLKKETDEMSGLYMTLMQLDENSDEMSGLAFLNGRYPVGFALWHQNNLKVANLLAQPCDVNTKGLAEFQVVKCCQCLSAQGIGHLNIGGSETDSLDRFKRKFQPATSLRLYSANIMYEGRSLT